MSDDIDVPLRRIDITFERLNRAVDELATEHPAQLAGLTWSWWAVVVFRIRAMERAEEAVRPADVGQTIADVYDRVVQPGEPVADALKRTLRHYFDQPAQNAHGDDPVTTP